jgi:serine/threonine protein kinase
MKKIPVEHWSSTDKSTHNRALHNEEVQAMASISSPYVVSLYDAFQSGPYIHIITEFCEEGNLRGYMGQRELQGKRMTEEVSLRIFRLM